MNLKALQSLVTIHDCQSFLEAARRLGVNQSSISMQIKALEEYLGVELFDRSVRPPAMTSAAIAIVQPAREILALLDVVQERARHPAALAGHLLLGAISTSTLGLLPDALTAIQRRYPAIQIRVESGLSAFLIEHVSRGVLDAAVVTEPQVLPAGLRSEIIMRERLALVSAIGSKGPASVADLSQHRFIRFNRKVGVGEIIERFLASRSLMLDESMELDSVEAILAMVERGHGVSIVPERSVEAYRQRVTITPLADEDAIRNVSFVFRLQSEKLPLLEAVSAAMQTAVRGGSGII